MEQVERDRSADVASLIAELAALGLHFVVGNEERHPSSQLTPPELIAGLAQQADARLRMALIALFLYRSDLATAVPTALSLLNEKDQMQLQLLYTAAVLMQQRHEARLKQIESYLQPLPDYFSRSLGLDPFDSTQTLLRQLSHRHREFSGIAANWLGTYYYAANRLITRLEKEAAWAT